MPSVSSMSRQLWLATCIAWGARTGWLAAAYTMGIAGVARHHVETASFILAALLLPVVLFLGRRSHDTLREVAGRSSASVALCIAAAVVLYWPTLSIGLLSDDFVLMERAKTGALMDPDWEMVRPVPLGIWAFVHAVLPDSVVPLGLHALNVTLHGLNAALVGRLAGHFGCDRRTAAIASILFLVFPMNVEAVTWSSAVFDVLLCTLTLSISLLVVRDARLSRLEMMLAVVLTIAALGTKETAVAVPILMAVALFMKFGFWWVDGYRAMMWCAALAAVYVAWRAAVWLPSGTFPPLSGYAAKELLSRPFAALAMPYHERVVRTAPVLVALSVAILPVLFAVRASLPGAVRLHASLLGGTTLWVLAAVAPVFTILFIAPDLQGARYMYLPSAAWTILVASLSQEPRKWLRRCTFATGALWLIFLTASVRIHTTPWIEAARVRDRIIASVVSQASNCSAIVVDRPLDNIDGAYVFRNGLPQALASNGMRVHVRAAGDVEAAAACRVVLPDALSEPRTGS